MFNAGIPRAGKNQGMALGTWKIKDGIPQWDAPRDGTDADSVFGGTEKVFA